MEAIFHEQQDGSLCAQHCLNSLLQGQFYSAVDLADMANELDTMEKLRMAEMGEDTPEYRQFLQQPSTNMDDSGFFSVQVISKALSVWGLDLLPLSSSNPEAVRAKNSAISANAYICNFREHWFTIRRLGSQWFNLNSLLEGPELVSNTYLGEFLAQLQHEGYSIFLITGDLPPCDADLVLQAVPASQLVPPRLLSDVQSSGSQSRQGRQSAGTASTGGQRPSGQTDEEAELEAAMLMSLAETSGSDGGPANIDSDQLARMMEMQRQGGWGPETEQGGEDEEMERALRMSMTSHTGAEAGGASEEDEIQRAIALSLAGGAGLGVGQPPASGGGQDGGWGARLRQQEVEEERLYKEEQEKSAKKEQEELEKALAMSMEGGSSAPAVSGPSSASAAQIDPVHTAWPKMRNPGEGTLAGHQPSPSTRAKPENPATSEPSPKTTSQPRAGPSPSKPSPVIQTSVPENSDRPSLAKTLMPEGPGHRLGGPSSTSSTAAPSGGRAAARPGASGAASGSGQPRAEDPEEIRRRRMAFLDKLQKSPPGGQQ